MRCILASIMILTLWNCNRKTAYLQTDQVQLSMPQVTISHTFFQEETEIFAADSGSDIVIRYTTDGAAPSINSPACDESISISNTSHLKFAAFAPDMITSPFREVSVYKVRDIDISTVEATPSSKQYPGDPSMMLFDKKKGSFNFKDGHWLGYGEGSIFVKIWLSPGQDMKGVAVSTLVDQKSWIFGPASIEMTVFGEDELEATFFKKLDSTQDRGGVAFMNFAELHVPQVSPTKIELVIKSPKAIPDWHPGKGNIPWLFIDEIVIL